MGLLDKIASWVKSDSVSTSAANANTPKTANPQELSHALSGEKKPDLDMGVTIQGRHFTEEELNRNKGTLRETPASDIAKHKLSDFISNLPENALKFIGALTGLGLTSCTPMNAPDAPHVGVSLTLTNKELADWVVGKLNDPDFCDKYGIEKETKDGIGYEFGYDPIQGSENVKPYIIIGDGIKLYIDPKTPPTDQNVFDYITQIGDDLKTKDGIGYHFDMVDGKPRVVLDNGFTHMYGENMEVKDNSPLGTLYGMFGKVGLDDRENKANELLTNIDALQNSYGNDEEGIKFELVPGDLKEVTEGNPRVKGSVYGFEFDGNIEKLDTGEVIIRGADGKEQLRFKTVGEAELFDLGSVMPMGEGVLVTTADGNELLMQKLGTTGFNMGKVDRENGTFTQAYPPTSQKFDTDNALDGDKYFDEKRGNLTDTQNEADETFRKYKGIGGHVDADAEVIIDTPPYRD